MIGPSAETLIIVGAKQTSLIVQEKEWWRLVTPMVLHAGIIHFVLNMLAMWFIGYAVEMNHGFMAIAILFIVPAIGGTLLSALFLPEYISVGASGGIFGLIGGCIADIVTNWNLLFSKEVHISNDGQRFRNVKVLVWLLVDILLNVLIGLTPFVDNFTHLGGMVYGFLCGLSKLERLSKAFFGVQKGLMSKVQNWLVRFFGILLSLCFIIITLVVLIRSDGTRTPCKGCRYVSCVPFPFWAEYADKWWYCDDCDLVTADAKQNTRTNFYSSMNMTCPDGEVAFIDLAPDTISDKAFLTKQLPKYCRSNCQNLFQG
jgi:membrane associated rhomboid family serine protease